MGDIYILRIPIIFCNVMNGVSSITNCQIHYSSQAPACRPTRHIGVKDLLIRHQRGRHTNTDCARTRSRCALGLPSGVRWRNGPQRNASQVGGALCLLASGLPFMVLHSLALSVAFILSIAQEPVACWFWRNANFPKGLFLNIVFLVNVKEIISAYSTRLLTPST